jgi:hypothetical protein
VQQWRGIILVGFPRSKIAGSWLIILVIGVGVRILGGGRLLHMLLWIHREGAFRILNLLHIHLMEWAIRLAMSELLLRLIRWLLLHDPRAIHSAIGIGASSRSTGPRAWSITLPWSFIDSGSESALLLLSLILELSWVDLLLHPL